MPRTILASAALLSVLALAACSAKTGANSSTAATSGADNSVEASSTGTATTAADAPLYPSWAQAVVPPYPNTTVGMLVNTKLYQFQSTDDRATVYGWYKSHLSGPWKQDATSGDWSTTVNGVQIGVSENSVTTGDAANVKTMVELSQR